MIGKGKVMSTITIDHVTKKFGDNTVIKDFSATIDDGCFATFLGPSGCGKTTMLRLVAGFERPDAGEIRIDDVTVSGKGVFVSPEKRQIGMVFQSYAVWPHMNVFDNVAYPLKIMKLPKDTVRQKVSEALEMVHMNGLEKRMPSQLSGGQQQRIALCRALVAQPKVLLLDEPLSNLDARLREEMRCEIKELQQRLKITVIYVTHDQREAMTMSDVVFVLNEGVIEQSGSPVELYRDPKDGFVENFLGKVNFLEGEVCGDRIRLAAKEQYIDRKTGLEKNIEFAIRPDDIYIINNGSFLHD